MAKLVMQVLIAMINLQIPLAQVAMLVRVLVLILVVFQARALLAQERHVQRKAQPADTQVAAGMSAAPGAPAVPCATANPRARPTQGIAKTAS